MNHPVKYCSSMMMSFDQVHMPPHVHNIIVDWAIQYQTMSNYKGSIAISHDKKSDNLKQVKCTNTAMFDAVTARANW